MKPVLFGICVMWLVINACQTSVESEKTSGNTDLLNISSHDTTERPQSNFYLYANGNWLKKTEIPPSQSSWGAFSILLDSSIHRLNRILDSVTGIPNAPKGSIAQQTGDFYFSAMDSAGIEKKGLSAVKSELDSIAAVKTKSDLYNEIAREWAVNHAPFFAFAVGADDRNSLVNVAHFNQGGLGLPSRDYYFKNDSTSIRARAGYITYITKIFVLTGQTPAQASLKANSIFQLETAMAKVSKSPDQLRNPIDNYNPVAVSGVQGLKTLLTKMDIHADTVLVGQPAFYKGLHTIIQTTPLETLKDYLSFHVLNDDAEYLPKDFADAKFEFTKLQTGQTVNKERWKRMTSLTDENLGDNLGQIYIHKYFTAADKARISELVVNITETLGEKIQQLDWMSDSTKKKALIKLHAIVKKVGYPDKWKDYSSINISRDDIIGNLRGVANYNYKKDIAKIGKPVDRTEWQMTTPTINAYYDPTQNNINFPAGILQPPFYFSNGDDALNYGAIGLVIGHEISHGFDDEGRQYDGDGNLKDWWTKEDTKKFTERAAHVINQYNGFIAADTFHLNGKLTEGENIADIGGLSIAYAAFKKTAQGKSNDKIDGFTPDQRFFLAHAQVWKTKTTKARLITLALTNPHSTPEWRVNGPVSNMPSFYEAFNVQPTDSMYRPDSLRVKIW